MQVDVAAQRALHAPAGARRAARARAARRALRAARARASTSASTPSRRWPAPPATSRSRQSASAARTCAFVSYHMGIGNLESVLARLRRAAAPPYVAALLRLDAARHRARLPAAGGARRRLLQLLVEAARGARDHAPVARGPGDSSTGWPRCTPRRRPPRRSCTRPTDRRASRRPTTWRRPGTTATIVPFPQDEAVTGLRRDRRMGELARRIDQPAERYRGLRPEALAMALYIGAQVRELSGQAPLVVTSTVRDGAYQRAARRPQPRGDAALLAAHDRLGVRRAARLPLAPPGARVPVRARPAARR